jgi:hypothetical protein
VVAEASSLSAEDHPQQGSGYTLTPVSGPTTQSIRLRWRPEQRFHEQQTAILRSFEQVGPLELFSVGVDTVDAKLSQTCWISMAGSGITVSVLGETDDTSTAWGAIAGAVAVISPLHYTHARASYQHVLELPFDDFAEAVDRGHARLYRDLSTQEVTLGDWALLSDVTAAGPPSSRGQIEFGIVRNDEVPFRLNRLGGRGPGMQHLAQRPWDESSFKKVSLFADSDLRCDAEPGREVEFLEDASAFWTASRSQMTRLVTELRRKMIDKQDGATS